MKRNIQIRIIGLLFLLTLFLIFPLIQNLLNISSVENRDTNFLKTSAQKAETREWIKNPTFESPIEPIWFWENGSEGDNSDMNATTSSGQANYEVLGDTRTITVVSGIINSSTSPGWKNLNKTGFLPPDITQIRSYGCYASHFWNDDPNQFPSAQWKTNISVPIDMSDYVITGAYLEVIVNASVRADIDTPLDDYYWQNFAIGDSVTFYAQISDLDYNPPLYTVASNKTKYLGQWHENATYPSILTITDSPLETVAEIDLITALNSAFEKDPSHSNFTLTLGIDIYSEDNLGIADPDHFDDLIIKTCNLTFTVKKKIDHSTTLSWNQISDKLDSQVTEITDARFNFEYKADMLWPAIAPLSEIRFFINDKLYEEGTIKLSNVSTSFQEAKLGGFDVTGFIEMDANISVSIQVYLKDSFVFDDKINISITEVSLNISYVLTLPDHTTNLQLFLNNENKTLDPFLEVPVGELINITAKFTNTSTGAHLIGANVLLTGDRILENLTEINEYFTTEINSSSDLNMGDNYLTIKAQFLDHETMILNPRIKVRKIKTEIIPVLATNIFIKPGESVDIDVIINNTDYDTTVKGAIVTYSWELGQGEFTDDNNDGIYNSSINNIPEGVYTITITAFSGEDYSFETFQIVLTVSIPVDPIWSILLYVLIGGIIGIVTIFTIYQTRLKYPPVVRKVRKLRKKIRKGKKLKQIIIDNRENIIERNLKEKHKVLKTEIETTNENKKLKPEELESEQVKTATDKGGLQ